MDPAAGLAPQPAPSTDDAWQLDDTFSAPSTAPVPAPGADPFGNLNGHVEEEDTGSVMSFLPRE